METSFVVTVDEVELEPWPLEPRQVVEGSPEVRGVVLHASGAVVRGVWEHGPGTSRDVEADELFVVVAGRGTVEIEGGPTLELRPGVLGVLRAGDRTVWTVHETLRKVFQTTDSH